MESPDLSDSRRLRDWGRVVGGEGGGNDEERVFTLGRDGLLGACRCISDEGVRRYYEV